MRVNALISGLVMAILAGVPSAASAQTIVLKDKDKLPRVTKDGKPAPRRSPLLMPEAFSRKDCVEDLIIRFALNVGGFEPDGVVEAWVADERVDCFAKTNRAGEGATCSKLASAAPAADLTIERSVREILSALPPFTPAKPAVDDEACGKVDRTTINIWFFYFAKGADETPLATTRVTRVADTIGPPAPTNLRVSRGTDFRVAAAWDRVPVVESDLTSTQAFCASNDGDLDAGTCSSGHLVSGTFPIRPACGIATVATATTMTINEATRGAAAIALASVDALGNTGPLSELACVPAREPAPPSDDGCAVHASPRSGEGILFALLLVALRARAQRRSKAELVRSSTCGGASSTPHV